MSSTNGSVQSLPQHVRVGIVGTGFSGIGMAIRLQAGGHRRLRRARARRRRRRHLARQHLPGLRLRRAVAPVLVLVRAEPRLEPHLLAPARDLGLPAPGAPSSSASLPHMRFDHELVEATWDDERQRLALETSQGTLTADVLVSGVGGARASPRLPDIPGLESFEGTTFHSAHWDHDYDLERQARRGDRHRRLRDPVRAADPAQGRASCTLFQRTPPWIVPQPRPRDEPRASARLYRCFPPAQLRDARADLLGARAVRARASCSRARAAAGERMSPAPPAHAGPRPGELRAKLTPTYPIGCKRVLISDRLLPGAAAAERRARHGRDRARSARSGSCTADGTRARGRRDHLRHRLPRHRHADRPAGARRATGACSTRSGSGSPQAYLGTTVSRLPEPVHAARAEHRRSATPRSSS